MEGKDTETEGEEAVQRFETEVRGDGPSPNDLYGSLASTMRRRVLYFLLERNRTTVDELADVLAGWEAAAENEVVDSETHRRLCVSLRHAHLPRLAEAGLVAYDVGNGDVSLAVESTAALDVIRHTAKYEQKAATRD